MVLNIFKKKAPTELPDLAIGGMQSAGVDTRAVDSILNELSRRELFPAGQNNKASFKQLPVQQDRKMNKKLSDERSIKQFIEAEDESGFFKDMLKNITSEMNDINKLDKWYQSRFKGGDIVGQMREYWERQKPELALRSINNELVVNLRDKIERFHALEKEWQEIYMQLMEKESQMREDEKELKESLSEFIDVCKRKLGNSKSGKGRR